MTWRRVIAYDRWYYFLSLFMNCNETRRSPDKIFGYKVRAYCRPQLPFAAPPRIKSGAGFFAIML